MEPVSLPLLFVFLVVDEDDDDLVLGGDTAPPSSTRLPKRPFLEFLPNKTRADSWVDNSDCGVEDIMKGAELNPWVVDVKLIKPKTEYCNDCFIISVSI